MTRNNVNKMPVNPCIKNNDAVVINSLKYLPNIKITTPIMIEIAMGEMHGVIKLIIGFFRVCFK